ncbi:MAG: hypothetical protein U0794_21805, partial [Isosphaeraceae bacterium]
RILVIGDSLTESQGAPSDSTLTAQWQKILDRDGVAAEVINLGVVAANIIHLTQLTRDAVPLLHPTDVVVVVYANDLPCDSYQLELNAPGPVFPRRLEPWWMPRVVEVVQHVLRNEPIYRRWPHPAQRFFSPVPDPTNPWTKTQGPSPGLDPAIYQAMVNGRINPWLKEQAEAIPGMLSHDFSYRGRPDLFFARMDQICKSKNATFTLAYIPFCGVVSPRYAAAQVKLGMPTSTAEALSTDPKYRNQQTFLAKLSSEVGVPLAETTEALRRAEEAGTPQYWDFDTHPRPAGYATIAREIHEVWSRSHLRRP